MRFKAKIRQISQLTRVIQTLEKLQKTCTMLVTPTRITFIINTDIVVWAGMNADSLCGDGYRVESLNNNEIGLEVDLTNMHRALKSAQSAIDVEIRLTKKGDQPYLSFTITTQGSQLVTVTQDVPVVVLLSAQLRQLTEPQLPLPDVQIFLPPLKQLSSIVDKLSRISHHLMLIVSMNGELTLKVESDVVSVGTFYSKLKNPLPTTQAPSISSVTQTAEATVDAKQFAKILYSYLVNPNDVVCCILEKTLVLDVRQDGLFLTFYIPTINVS